MSGYRDEIEASIFKRVPDGYVFRAPNPWVFGRARHHLASEAQKAEIMSIMVPRRPKLILAAVIVALLLFGAAAGAAGWALSGHDNPTAGDAVIMVAVILGAMYVTLIVSTRHKIHRLAPVLAGMLRTEQTITYADRRQALASTMSFRRVLALGGLLSFSSLLQVFVIFLRSQHHPFLWDPQCMTTAVAAICLGLGAARFFAVAYRKSRQARA
ncbi:hypothetical protein SAMN05519103_05259 [Rhizobiales bacterium GAS113]|nr:hypothetical protein SAMN05519103_05259 [Rhizobiales bacterium GAS113]